MLPDTTTLSQYKALSNAILDWEIIANLCVERGESCESMHCLDSLTWGWVGSSLVGVECENVMQSLHCKSQISLQNIMQMRLSSLSLYLMSLFQLFLAIRLDCWSSAPLSVPNIFAYYLLFTPLHVLMTRGCC